MSRNYKKSSDVPLLLLICRLRELSNAVTKGEKGINREFYMSIPCEVDKDADMVLSEAADRLEAIYNQIGKPL